MALRWLAVVLAGSLVLPLGETVRAQEVPSAARQLDAPEPPGSARSTPPPPEVVPARSPVVAPPPLDPHPRRGMAGIIAGWSGFGVAVASLAMMATCDPFFDRVRDSVDTEDLTDLDQAKAEEVQQDVHEAASDGARICRVVYGAFAGAGGTVAVLGLPVGYGRRHRYRKRLQLSLQPTVTGRSGAFSLVGRF